ncbi:ABC transporter substrate-binding protein [Clostridium sp. C8-1-8]|uniref:ABC transporter substrate-binding protein n=1 Tax=Clostridium sp. C8-1-8 TaxID=2698831 RepID=UPI00136894F6|nr:ABC transporter substrate-binding protein [Clostridium sp. C8-1-8]
MKFLKLFVKLALTTTIAGTMLVGCGGSSQKTKTASTGVDASGTTHMEMWTFVDLHAQFYKEMEDLWNKENPTKKLDIKFTVLPYDDMHNKLQTALLSGKGAPDMCDVELGKFANFLKGEPQLVPLNDAIEPYKSKLVQARLDIYTKDGKIYGVPTHVGATVAFYNKALLEKAGIDYTKIITWDDFKAAGEKYYKATGKYLGTADTADLWQVNALLAQQGSDLTDASGKPKVNTPEMVKALTMLKELQKSKAIATVPGGNPDSEQAYGAFNKGDYACAIMPMWQMSRYTNYMKDQSGKIAIAPVPVFEKGEPRSVGGGGTGTVVTKTAKNTDLAKAFLTYAKLSDEGATKIWQKLGFDPVNTDIWSKNEITHDPNNTYVKYFVNNPFDVLNEIKNEVKVIKVNAAYPTINNTFTTVTLNNIFESNKDIKQELDDAQKQIENELK